MHSSVSRSRPRKIPDSPRRHLTPSEVAEIFGITADTVRRWTASGLLPSARLGPGRRIVIDPADLEKLYSAPLPSDSLSNDEGDVA